ncbi:hypothetical protein [Martelella alba]|uniref:hypothetical protein n=1 Tax=Martelella alba TaxID=2590451 RepID=UPI001E34AE9B|nr:hypothetical protein [Martelella alba]
MRTSKKGVESGKDEKGASPSRSPDSPDTKPIRGTRRDPPVNAFRPNNQVALKHGGYARRMLISDETNDDANALWLDDELFWLRARNLTAAENIGRWTTEFDDADGEQKKVLMANIGAAEKAMHRNTTRIESLEYTKSTIMRNIAATEKMEIEAENLRNGDNGNQQIIIHNSLNVPGRK